MKTLIIGFDSAWTARKKGAMVAVISSHDTQTSNPEYKLLQPPVIVDWSTALQQVRTWVDSHSPFATKIYIDQPTIVSNTSGQRPVENIVGSLISYHYGGMQPSSLKRDDMFGPLAPITNFINALNADVRMSPTTAPIQIFETYPTLSIIAKGWLSSKAGSARSRLPRYNPENRAKFSLADWQQLCQQLAQDFKQKGISEICDYLATLEALDKPDKYDQDRLDACLCLMAGLDAAVGKTMTVGQPDTGFIVVPYGEAAYEKLVARCIPTGRDPDAWLNHLIPQVTYRQGSLDDVVLFQGKGQSVP